MEVHLYQNTVEKEVIQLNNPYLLDGKKVDKVRIDLLQIIPFKKANICLHQLYEDGSETGKHYSITLEGDLYTNWDLQDDSYVINLIKNHI